MAKGLCVATEAAGSRSLHPAVQVQDLAPDSLILGMCCIDGVHTAAAVLT